MHPFHQRVKLVLLAAALTLGFAACDATATVTQTTGSSNSTTGATTPPNNATPAAATPTATTPATCASLMPGAGPATGGPNFGDIQFPPNSVSTPQVLHSSGTGQYTISLFNACSPNTSATNVKSFYATQMLAEGWGQDPTLPFNGSYQQNCGDPYCWEKGPNPISRRLSGLESVTDRGNNIVTYTWRVFSPPPQGTCKAADFPTMTNATGLAGYQLPPVTTYYDFTPGAGSHVIGFCSAGDATSILTFMKKSIVAAGWKITSTTSTQVNAESPDTSDPSVCFTLNITAGTVVGYPGEWSQNTHPPATNCV